MPYLVQTRGPSAGTTFAVEHECVLGRNPDCDVVIPHDSVSRHHARIVLRGESYFVEDLNSRNGTTLNNIVIHGRCRLSDGDMVRMSNVEFTFWEQEVLPPGVRPTGDSDTRIVVRNGESWPPSPVHLSLEMRPRFDLSRLATTAQAKLHALLDISQSLGRCLALERLFPKTLDCLFDMLPQAERGCIVLRDEAGELVPVHTKALAPGGEHCISRTIVDEAIRTKKAILSSDASHDPRFAHSESVSLFRIRSFMCAPLIDDEGEAFGVIQVETDDWEHAFQQEELELLVGVTAQSAMAITVARLHLRELQRRTLERDLELAAQVQHNLLPKAAPALSDYVFADYYQPAEFVGGDYFDYVTTPSGRTAIIIADVAGHGIAAALSMSKLSAEVRLLAGTLKSPARILNTLNANLWRQGLDTRFITLLLAMLDPARHQVTLGCAGHMPPILRRRSGSLHEPGRQRYGPPLGAVRDVQYEETAFRMEPGDTLTLYTDGITEATDPSDLLYGEEEPPQ